MVTVDTRSTWLPDYQGPQSASFCCPLFSLLMQLSCCSLASALGLPFCKLSFAFCMSEAQLLVSPSRSVCTLDRSLVSLPPDFLEGLVYLTMSVLGPHGASILPL